MLKPGGRFAVSGVVRRHGADIPIDIRRNMELWAGCIAGALSDQEYTTKLAAAGFTQVGIEVTRVYEAAAARSFIEAAGLDYEKIAAAVDGAYRSGFVRAVKPAA